MFVDSHCRLSFPELHTRIAELRSAMRSAEVDRALCICTTLEEFPAVHTLAQRYDNFWASVGVHPDSEDVQEPSVVAIGETGLDYYRLNGRSIEQMDWQRERFAVHIRAARRSELPLIVHTRNAAQDTLALLRSEGEGAVRGVFHCFTESQQVADAALDMGFFISFSGILSFKNAAELREVARRVPLERCLIETDSPYLAPVPHRGRINQPAYVRHVAEQLADLKGCSLQRVAEVTTANFEQLFRRSLEATTEAPNG